MVENEFNLKPKKRFSSRVENYIKYRPSYPQEIITFLTEKKNLLKSNVIADIGSGTGILSELFLKNSYTVYGVEPNVDMRNAGQKMLSKYPKFVSIKGSAEDTTLNKNSIDIITAGQSFHWFDLKKARIEFLRILKSEGWVILIWNRRKKRSNEFLKDYEKLLMKYGTDYIVIEKKKLNYDKFFGVNKSDNKFQKKKFDNSQEFNFKGLKGRLLSTSYIPLNDHPMFKEMISDLRKLFKKHQQNRSIRFEYNTVVIYGQLA